MVLEEFSNSNSVSHHMLLYLLHKWSDRIWSWKIDVCVSVGWFCTSIWVIDRISEDIAVIQESKIFNIAKFVGVDVHNGLDFGVIDVNAKESCGLFELLWANLEMIVSILILKEGFGVKSFSCNEWFEFLKQVLDILVISTVWLFFTIKWNCSSVI